MKSGVKYLLAARQCEIGELERLAETGELVGAIGRFTHALQRERGITNLFLASRGGRFDDMRLEQALECDRLQQQTVAAFERLDTRPGTLRNGARLFNRIAGVMHGLEGLPELRAQVAAHSIAAAPATAAYVRLVAGLLSVVFEAADSAGDPAISRSLVALFNFMQGKEFAGQERAHGAAVFASGHIDAAGLRTWRHLIEQQQHAFGTFTDFAEPEVLAAEHASHDAEVTAQVEQLRRVGWTLAEGAPDDGVASAWYRCMTDRIDAMRRVEDALTAALRRLCERKIAEARAVLRDESALLASFESASAEGAATLSSNLGPRLERSVLDMVQEQSRQLQAMSDELDAVRATLNERKLIERAKGLLMAHRHLSEDDAYKLLRQTAMNQKRRLSEVAETVLSMADMLPARGR